MSVNRNVLSSAMGCRYTRDTAGADHVRRKWADPFARDGLDVVIPGTCSSGETGRGDGAPARRRIRWRPTKRARPATHGGTGYMCSIIKSTWG